MAHARPRHIVHVITGLGLGGAEMMLYKVLTKLDPARYSAEVISLSPASDLQPRIEELGFTVTSLAMEGVGAAPAAFLALRRHFAHSSPAVVQTWMYHADLLGGLAARWEGIPVVWNIQGSNLDPRSTRRLTRGILATCAWLSNRVPARIVSCGPATAATHAALGYAADRMAVIPNAVDTARFTPDAQARTSVRAELGLSPEARIISMGARFDLQKDHQTLLAAWGRLKAGDSDRAHLLLFGKDVVRENTTLCDWINTHRAADVHLLGPRSDVPRLLAACDASCLSSAYGEGLPNIIAEAMACALPCVVTDVGDSAWVVGDAGIVVPPRDPGRLAEALAQIVSMPAPQLSDLGAQARRRVEQHFDLGTAAAQYYALYDAVSGS